MYSQKDNQGNFFDEYVRPLVPQDHILLKISNQIDFSFIDEETKDLYSQDFGRPAYPPETLFKMLFLEYYYNLSDVEVSRQCQYNLLYRYFVGLKLDSSTPDDTSLVVFRKRLGSERFERIFDRIVGHAKGKDLLKEKLKVVDASKVIADVAIPSTVNLIRQGRRKILKQIHQINPRRARSLTRRYGSKDKLFTKPTEEDLTQEVSLSREFLDEVKRRYGKKQALGEDIQAMEQIIEGEKKDRIVSFTDLDARFGRTSPEPKGGFCGYKAHIAEDESEIITSVDLIPGNQSEGVQLNDLLEKEDHKNIRSKAIVADGLYDSGDNYQLIRSRKMKPYITLTSRGRRRWDGFKYYKRKDRIRCPEQRESIGNIPQEDGFLHYFSNLTCKSCPRASNCLKPGETRARVFIKADYLFTGSESKIRKKALKLRKMIERKFGEAKKWHGMSRARYRRLWRVKIQVLMTFMVINTKRMTRLLEERAAQIQPRAAPS